MRPDEKASALPEEELATMGAQGKIWGITSFFNPQGYKHKLDNFRRVALDRLGRENATASVSG